MRTSRLCFPGVIAFAVMLALLGSAAVAAAQAPRVYQAFLTIRRAGGTMDPDNGVGSINIKRWSFLLGPDSNGMQPDQQPVLVVIGLDAVVLPAGSLVASKNGRRFSYQDKTITRGIRSIRLWRGKDPMIWQLRVQIVGMDFSALTISWPQCLPMAVTVGDDDGFSGVYFNREGWESKRVQITGFCTPSDHGGHDH